MAHFTQLGLSATPEKKPEASTKRNNARQASAATTFGSKAAAFLGWMVITSIVGVALLEAGACSKMNRKAALKSNSSFANQTASTPQTAPSAASAVIAEAQPAGKPPQQKSRQHRLSASTYTNPAYGISFRYPKQDDLKEGEKANLQWAELGPVETNFVEAGATTLAAVELPRNLYPASDFTSGFFNVSVNSKMTPAQCEQFAFPQPDPGRENAATPSPELSKVKLGTAEFTEVEESGQAATQQADAKYYHVYQNGTCYEFVLGLETAAGSVTAKPVDSNEVFRKLSWILSTVKINPAGVPAPTAAEAGTPVAATVADGGKR